MPLFIRGLTPFVGDKPLGKVRECDHHGELFELNCQILGRIYFFTCNFSLKTYILIYSSGTYRVCDHYFDLQHLVTQFTKTHFSQHVKIGVTSLLYPWSDMKFVYLQINSLAIPENYI